MNINKFTKRLEIQRATYTKNAVGESIPSWLTLATRWASIEPISVREQLRANAIDVSESSRIRMRYYAGLKESDRLKHGDDIYEINSVVDKEDRHIELEILCTRAK
jgi:SPP1 family predicted phage head-tail adaptor